MIRPTLRPLSTLKAVTFRVIEPLIISYILVCLPMLSVETLTLDFSGTDQPESSIAPMPPTFPKPQGAYYDQIFAIKYHSWNDILSQNSCIEELTCEPSHFAGN